jgi:hypothetical protein
MYRTVGAVRHNSKFRNITQFSMVVVMEGVYFLFHFNIFYFNMIYLLTEIGLTSGGSSTVHIYTQTIHTSTQWNGIHTP